MTRFKKIMTTLALAGMLLFGFAQPSIAAPNLSDQIGGQVTAGAKGGGLGAPVENPQSALASLINIFLGFLATFFLILIIMSGYWLVTARGNDAKHEKAMDTIRRAVIGFAVVIMAYGISLFVGSLVKSSVNKGDNKHDCGVFQNISALVNSNSRCR